MKTKTFKQLLDVAKTQEEYWVGKSIIDFTEDLYRLMELAGVNKAELARRVDTERSYITKVLSGESNFTIQSMVKLVRALDGEIHIRACRKEDQMRWFGVLKNKENLKNPLVQNEKTRLARKAFSVLETNSPTSKTIKLNVVAANDAYTSAA